MTGIRDINMRMFISVYALICFVVLIGEPPIVQAAQDHIQLGKINIRLRSGVSIEDAKDQLKRCSVPELSMSEFKSIMPIGFQSNMNNQETSRNYITPLHEQLNRTYTLTFSENTSVSNVIKVISSECPYIELAEPRYNETILIKPNDTYINNQLFLPIIKANDAWDIFSGDSNIVIGIIDNGILQIHEDLADNISVNIKEIDNNGLDDDNNGFIDDAQGVNLAWPNDGLPPGTTYNPTDGHGTSVAGVAAARWNNQKGIAGVGGKTRFFPIKAGKQSTDRVEYGYEGILYGIMRGFPVLNCSWGSANTYSEINQSIIDFAVERDVLIVAGAGNDNNRAPVYPASYRGVMSVGETDISDMKSNGSSYSWSTDIMAPGFNVRTLDNEQYSYTNMSGTSFAAPIISGAAALLKGKYPTVSMEILQEHLKATADPIDIVNSFLAGFLPGRVNLLRAMLEAPTKRPYIQTTWSQEHTKRYVKGDTISIRLQMNNVSDIPAKNIALTFTSLDNFFKPFTLLDTFRIVSSIPAHTTDTSVVLRMIIKESSDAEFYHSLRIEEESGILPTVLIPLRPTPSITTFTTKNLTFSVGDYGSLGFINERTVGSAGNEQFDGMGFILNHAGSMLYDGGLLVGSSGKIITGFSSSSSFEPRIRFATQQEGAFMVLTDSLNPGSEKIGVSIKQEIAKLAPNSVTFKFTLSNMNDEPIYNPGFGIFGDWDIGNYGRENRVERFEDAIPQYMLQRCEAEIAWKDGLFAGKPHPFVGIMCFAPSKEQSFKPQAAGLNALVFSNTNEDYNSLLNAGNTMQYGSTGDIAMFVGGRFERTILSKDSVTAYIIIGSDTSRKMLEGHLKNAVKEIEGAVSVQNPEKAPNSIPQIVDNGDFITVFLNRDKESSPFLSFSIFNLQGVVCLDGHINGRSVVFSKQALPAGLYLLQIHGLQPVFQPLIIR